MVKKFSQVSAKICKTDKKQFNSLIDVLKPKVYITDASNFKRLVQELTGNGNPISFNPPPIHHEQPVMAQLQVPIIDIDEQECRGYRELSFDSSVDSSEASFPTSFATASESSPDVYGSETFDVLESSFVNATSNSFKNFNDFPDCGDIESWLLEIDNYTFKYDLIGDCLPETAQQEVSVYGYGFSDIN